MTTRELKAEFEEKFGTFNLNDSAVFRGDIYKAKDFVWDWILEKLEAERVAERDRILALIEEERWIDGNIGISAVSETSREYIRLHNDALDTLIKKIQS